MRYLYLHGFASSPASRKALAFAKAMHQHGIVLEIPALDRDDFGHLTITSQLSAVGTLLQNEPACLIGSSLGGYLAAIYASTHPEIDRLILLAPAFRFAPRWRELTGPRKILEWEETGWMDVYHYGTKQTRRLHSGLLADAEKYSPEPDFWQAARIFHGRQDQIVPIDLSRAFAAGHPNVSLTELESDHELLNVLEDITSQALPFLIGKGSQLA